MKDLDLLKDIGTQINDSEAIHCPDCLRIEKFEQPLCTVGDHENELFCPHCDLQISLKLEYRSE